MKIYTRKGDDGTTGLLYGGRVTKDETGPEAYGTVDEAMSAIGVARSLASGAAAEQLLMVQREMFVVGAELATAAENRRKLVPGVSLLEPEPVDRLEAWIDQLTAERGMPTEFVVPGGNPLAAALDMARSVVRRAERRTVTHARTGALDGSHVVPYLNRLADWLYMMARVAEAEWVSSKEDE